MKRKLLISHDGGMLECSPPISDRQIMDFADWYYDEGDAKSKERFDHLPEIDDDELLLKYYEAYKELYAIEEEIFRKLKKC